MNNSIGRMTRLTIIFLLAFVSSNVLAITEDEIKNIIVYSGPLYTGEESAEVQRLVSACFEPVKRTMDVITPMVVNAGIDPLVAQEMIKPPVDLALQPCIKAKDFLEKNKNSSPRQLVWVKTLIRGWRATRNTAGRAAYNVARYNDSTNTYLNNWLPKLHSKKKKFREIGKKISEDYNMMMTMFYSTNRDHTFEQKLANYKITVNTANTLQKSLVALHKDLSNDIKDGEPKQQIDEESLYSYMSPILKKNDSESWWRKHYEKWNYAVNHAFVELTLAHGKASDASASIRESTLFRNHGEPLKGLDFDRIYPTFKMLYDDLYKKGKDYEIKVAAEDKRWEEESNIVKKYFDECGASNERDWRLFLARIGIPADVERNLRLEDSRRVLDQEKKIVDRYNKTFPRPMTAEQYYEKYKDSGESKAKLINEYNKLIEKLEKEKEAEIQTVINKSGKIDKEKRPELEKKYVEASRQYKDWENECSKRDANIDKIMKDNAKRRKQLGLPRSPLYGS